MALSQDQLDHIKQMLKQGKMTKFQALEALLKGDASVGDSVKEEAKKEREKVKVSCTEYKVVKVNEHCRHCGATEIREVTIKKSDHVPIIMQDNEYLEVHYKQAPVEAVLQSYTGSCRHCDDFIASMDRDTLEARYKELLRHYISFNMNSALIADKQTPIKVKEVINEVSADVEYNVVQEQEEVL